MVYSGVKCRTCHEVFAIDEIQEGPTKAGVREPSFKGSLTCPHCNARHEYTSSDITFYEGNVQGNPPTSG